MIIETQSRELILPHDIGIDWNVTQMPAEGQDLSFVMKFVRNYMGKKLYVAGLSLLAADLIFNF